MVQRGEPGMGDYPDACPCLPVALWGGYEGTHSWSHETFRSLASCRMDCLATFHSNLWLGCWLNFLGWPTCILQLYSGMFSFFPYSEEVPAHTAHSNIVSQHISKGRLVPDVLPSDSPIRWIFEICWKISPDVFWVWTPGVSSRLWIVSRKLLI